MARRLLILITLPLLATAACKSPVERSRMREPELRVIQHAFDDIVEKAGADPDVEWVHGWGGNSKVKATADGSVRGLCWEWQEHVYKEILPTVDRVGWAACGITINFGVFSEHHAVVVYDPRLVPEDELLGDPTPVAYVLDAWQDGRADIYTLEDWLGIPWIVFVPAELEVPDPPTGAE